MNVKKMTLLSISVALAMVFSFIESQIPPLVSIPGVKIGLSNIVTVFLLYKLGAKEAAAVSLIRVLLSALLFGSSVSLIYSLSGAAVSFLSMIGVRKTQKFSTVGVSVVGGVMHNVAQIIAACFVMDTAAISLYLPPLIISGILAGIAVGIAAGVLCNRLKNIRL